MKKKIVVITSILTVSFFAYANEKFATYINDRFEYSVQYPSESFIPQGEAGNGDGQIFISKSKDAEFRVWGGWNIKEIAQMCHALYGIEDPDSPNIVYKMSKDKISAVSGYRGKKIFYRKVIVAGDRCLNFEFEYDTKNREKYDQLVGKMATSFRDTAHN